SANSGPGFNSLDGVVAVSASDAWAVGAFKDEAGLGRALTLHWNGESWTRIPTPSVGARGTFLNAATAVAPNDVWAVGAFRNGDDVAQTLALHWDGVSWLAVHTPNVGIGDNFLTDVSATGPNDVWAAGYRHQGTATGALIEHWNGSAWRVAELPTFVSQGDGLNGISASAPNDVWAVGGFSEPGL